MLSANVKKSKSRIMKGSVLAKKTTIKFFPGDNELQGPSGSVKLSSHGQSGCHSKWVVQEGEVRSARSGVLGCAV